MRSKVVLDFLTAFKRESDFVNRACRKSRKRNGNLTCTRLGRVDGEKLVVCAVCGNRKLGGKAYAACRIRPDVSALIGVLGKSVDIARNILVSVKVVNLKRFDVVVANVNKRVLVNFVIVGIV